MSTNNPIAALADMFAASEKDKASAKTGVREHPQGAILAYWNEVDSVSSTKVESFPLREKNATHQIIIQSYVAAAESDDPTAAKAELDAYWHNRMVGTFNFNKSKASAGIPTDGIPTFTKK
jgi:hypothetical protein